MNLDHKCGLMSFGIPYSRIMCFRLSSVTVQLSQYLVHRVFSTSDATCSRNSLRSSCSSKNDADDPDRDRGEDTGVEWYDDDADVDGVAGYMKPNLFVFLMHSRLPRL